MRNVADTGKAADTRARFTTFITVQIEHQRLEHEYLTMSNNLGAVFNHVMKTECVTGGDNLQTAKTLQVHRDALPQQCSEALADICLSDHASGPAVMYRYNV